MRRQHRGHHAPDPTPVPIAHGPRARHRVTRVTTHETGTTGPRCEMGAPSAECPGAYAVHVQCSSGHPSHRIAWRGHARGFGSTHDWPMTRVQSSAQARTGGHNFRHQRELGTGHTTRKGTTTDEGTTPHAPRVPTPHAARVRARVPRTPPTAAALARPAGRYDSLPTLCGPTLRALAAVFFAVSGDPFWTSREAS